MSRILVVLLMVGLCVLFVHGAEAKKKMKPGKGGKVKVTRRRMATIVEDLQDNVTALWTEVNQLSQPVHVHLHGDGHVMGGEERHVMPHEHGGHKHGDHHHDHGDKKDDRDDKKKDDRDDKKKDDDDKDHDKDYSAYKRHKPKHHDKYGDDDDHKHHDKNDSAHKHHDHKNPDHKHHDKDDDDDDRKHPDHDHEAMKKKMMYMKKKMMSMMKHRHGHDDDDDDDEGWRERYMQHGPRGTHVHIHLHTGGEEEAYEHHHAVPDRPEEYRYARCGVVGNSAVNPEHRQNITGIVHFRHKQAGKPLEIKAWIEGFNMTRAERTGRGGLRGVHVHELGDMSGGCNSLGGHLNPSGGHHGGPSSEHRHIGDLGNLQVERNGTTVTSFNDTIASLYGSDSLLGRSIVIHAGADDHGKGHNPGSKMSGNAGARIACCVIVASAKPDDVWAD